MNDLWLAVGLGWIDCEQIEVGGEYLLRYLFICAEDLLQRAFRILFGYTDILPPLKRV